MKVILIAKKNKPYVNKVILLSKKLFQNTIYFDAEKKINCKNIIDLNCDIIFSYISDQILSSKVLNNTSLYNINFHPGSTEYPGFGCFNFALYNKAKYYGCTAHLMNKRVDTGKIIDERNFAISKNETVLSLSEKTYKHMYLQFKNVATYLSKNKKIKITNNRWKRKPYKKTQLEKLCKLNIKMSKNEIQNRIQATYYPNKPGAYLNFKGYRFKLS
jgi:methionyl-tRNA formyltransferase